MSTSSIRITNGSSFVGLSTLTFAALYLMIVIVVAAAGVGLYQVKRQQITTEAEQQLDRNASGLADLAASAGVSDLRAAAERILQDPNAQQVEISDIDGRSKVAVVSGDTDRHLIGGLAALAPVALSTFRLARPIVKQAQALGTVRVDYRSSVLATSFSWIALIAFSVVALATLLVWRSCHRLSGVVRIPANAIELVKDQITRTGDLSVRLPQNGTGDFGGFEETVNRLLEQLDQQEQKRSLYREHLEHQVLKRSQDLSESNDRLRTVAYTSSETGLPNRAAFLDRMHKLCATDYGGGDAVALFVVRMARVRYANEAFGFDVGDLMIEAAGRNLIALCAPETELFHLGGAEFAAIYVGQTGSMHRLASELLRVDDVPFIYRGATLNVHPVVGYALFPDDAASVDDLTRFAMLALNSAAAPTSNEPIVKYCPALLHDSIAVVHIEASLKRAIDNGLFEPHFQHRIDTATGRVHGLEAFVRWTSPELAPYNNYQLIPIAERSLLATQLDAQMLRKVVQWMAALAADGIHVPVAVNLSAQTIQRPSLPDDIASLMHLHNVNVSQLEIDLTESILKNLNATATRNLMVLGEMGVSLLLDDFGSGNSTLRYLLDLPISTIKIDRAFIKELPDNAASLAIVESTIALARRLGKRVVAAGVETYGQWELLRSIGCDEVQGYFLMRPQEPALAARLLRQQFDTSVGHMTVDLANFVDDEDFSVTDPHGSGLEHLVRDTRIRGRAQASLH